MKDFPQLPFARSITHPMIEVLREVNNSKMPYETDPQEWQDLARLFTIPQIDRQIIQQAYDGLVSDVNNNLVFSSLQTNIQFDEASFLLLKTQLNDKSFTLKAAVDLIYYFIIAWLTPNNNEKLKYYFDFLNLLDKLENIITKDVQNFLIDSLTLKYNSFQENQVPIDIINKYYSKCTKENIYTMVDILDKAIQMDDSAKYTQIITTITLSVEKSPESFSSTDFSRLIQILYPLFFDLNPHSIGLLSSLTKVTSRPELLDAFAELPTHIFFPLEPDPNFTIEFTQPTFHEFTSYNYEYDYTFQEDIVSYIQRESLSDFEVTGNVKDFVLPNHKLNVVALAPVICEIPEIYATKFFESFADVLLLTKNRYDLYIDFLALLHHPNKTKYTKKIMEGINIFPVFTSETLFFKHDLGLTGIIRDSILSDFITYNIESLQSLLHNVQDAPFIFAEILGRLLFKLHLARSYSFINEQMLDEIVHGLNILLSILHDPKYEKYQTQIQDARSVIYTFIFTVIEDKDTAYRCFSSGGFAISFLSRILDNSLKNLVLEYFSKVLIGCTPELADSLTPAVKFIGAIFDFAKDTKFTQNIIDLLKTINNALNINNSLAEVFRNIIDQVTVYITLNPTPDIIKECLELVLHTHIYIGEYHLTNIQTQRISVAIQSLEYSEPKESIISCVLGMAGRSRSINMSGMFLLQNPELIPLFTSLFCSIEGTRKALLYLEALSKHSIRNTYLIQHSELDLILIESIHNYPNEFDFGGLHFRLKYEESDIEQLILPIIAFLSSMRSSPYAAAKFMTLFVPGEEYPKYAIPAMQIANKTLSEISHSPKKIMYCGVENHETYISGIFGNSLNEAMTITFNLWIDTVYAQSINAHPMLISILDENNCAIKFLITGNTLIAKILTLNGVSSAVIAPSLDSCKWLPVVISIRRIQDFVLQFEYSVNSVLSQSLSVQMPKFSDNQLEIRLGAVFDGNCEKEDALSYSTMISDLSLYPIAVNLRDEKYRMQNLVKQNKFDTKPLFTYPTEGMTRFTLTEGLASNFESFIPFFAYIDKTPPHFLDLLIDMMKELCKIGTHFDFPLIAYLLKVENNVDCLTYNLWCRFDSFLEAITDKDQIKSLISNIVMSADLWCRSASKEFTRIVNNWPSLLEFNLFEIIPFRNLLSYMRVFFYHDPVEKEIIVERRNDFDVTTCYNSMIKILKAHKMTEMDMAAIISHCGSCQDTEQVVSLLSILQNNGKTEYTTIPRLCFYLLKPRKEKIFIATLKAISSLTGEYFSHYVEAICSVIKPIYCTTELFDGLIQIVKDFPLIFPLLIICSIELEKSKFDRSYCEITASNLQPLRISPKLINPSWIIWPAILSNYLESKSFVDLVSFTSNLILDSDSFTFFEECIAHLELLSATRDENYLVFIGDLVKIIIDIKYSPSNDPRLFSLCSKILLLHRDHKLMSPSLQEVYEMSPFNEETPLKLIREKRDKVTMSANLFDLSDMNNTASSPLTSSTKLSVGSFNTVSLSNLPKIDIDFMSKISEYLTSYSKDFEIIPQFGYRGHEALLQTCCQIFTNMKEVSNVELPIGIYLQKVSRREKIDVSLQTLLIDTSIHYINQHANNENLKGLQNRTRSHWLATEKRANSYTLLFDTTVASIASGDIDAQVELSNFNTLQVHKKWNKIMKFLFNSSSSWSKKTPQYIYAKSFRVCGDIEEPLLKRKIPKQISFKYYEPTQNKPCKVIKIDKQIDAQFSMTNDNFTIRKEGFSKVYKYSELKYVLQRAPFHRYTAIELYFHSGKTIFLDFAPMKSIQEIVKKFQQLCSNSTIVQISNFQQFFHKLGLTEKWLKDEISNFEYLLSLNIFGGRSFRHPALYPIFPLVVLDFISEPLTTDQLRDLQWPISAQTLAQRKNLSQKLEDNNFLYFSAPSNPTIVAHWLLRLEPFTSLHLDNEGGHFDVQSRLFTSMMSTTVQVLESGFSWEIVPEFFDCPEFLLDVNKKGINDVECPLWGTKPFKFISDQRKVLESNYVTENLNLWIDMIFGYAQKDNKVRKQRLNSFNEILTEEVWNTEETLEMDEDVIEVTLNKSGHLPSTLFKTPHPQKKIIYEKPFLSKMVTSLFENKPLIEDASVTNFEYPLITFSVLYNNGLIETLIFDIDNQKNNRTILVKNIDQKAKKVTFVNGFVVINSSKSIKVYSSNGNELQNISNFNPVLFDQNSKTLAFVCVDASIKSIKKDFVIRTSLTDRIVCLCTSDKYKLICLCTSSSHLVLYRYDGQFHYDIVMEEKMPHKVMMTEESGTILVYSLNSVSVFTLNGFLVSSVKINFRISCWTNFIDKNYIEYVAVADTTGNVYINRLTDVKLDKASYRCPLAIPVSIAYNQGVVAVLSQSGKVYAMPLQ